MDYENFYYIKIEGNDDEEVFFDAHDKRRYIEILRRKLGEMKSQIYAFCIMDKYAKILIQIKKEDIQEALKRLNLTYMSFFNEKYKRSGPIFKKAYSKAIESNEEFKETIRHINKEPYKEERYKKLGIYKWSSYPEYMVEISEYVNTKFVLEQFSENPHLSRRILKQYLKEKVDYEIIDTEIILEETQTQMEKEINDIVKAFLMRRRITKEDLEKEEHKKKKRQLEKIIVEHREYIEEKRIAEEKVKKKWEEF